MNEKKKRTQALLDSTVKPKKKHLRYIGRTNTEYMQQNPQFGKCMAKPPHAPQFSLLGLRESINRRYRTGADVGMVSWQFGEAFDDQVGFRFRGVEGGAG